MDFQLQSRPFIVGIRNNTYRLADTLIVAIYELFVVKVTICVTLFHPFCKIEKSC